MGGIWDDRLAEVWAAPGKAGAGVVIGDETVLTAGHVVAGAASGGRVLARVVRPGVDVSAWIPMMVLIHDPAWDVAVLSVGGQSDAEAGPLWRKPSSQLVITHVGNSSEPGCEALGFPQSAARDLLAGDSAVVFRQTEQVIGILGPAGQGKAPVAENGHIPQRWMPLDAGTPTPEKQADWAGMSGAGVVLPDGRLMGLVVAVEAGHELRRLYVVPLAEVLARSPQVASALTAALGHVVIAQARDAKLYVDALTPQSLGNDGLPVLIGEAGLGAFGFARGDASDWAA